MELTVLGKYGPYPRAGGACSSYLLTCGETRILLDAGNGSLSNLQKHTDFRNISAIVLSHLHSDHISDLLVLRYAIQNTKSPPVPLYLPDSPGDVYALFKAEKAYQTNIITGNMRVGIGNASVTFKKMTHSVDSYAVKVKCGGRTLVYSGDTNMNDGLAGFALNADALLCDAAFSAETMPANPPHLTSAQAAQIARRAQVKKLYLTHIAPEQDENILLTQAKAFFINSEITVENNTVTI